MQHPMQPVLDPPVASNRRGEQLCRAAVEAADEVAPLSARLIHHRAFRLWRVRGAFGTEGPGPSMNSSSSDR